MQKSHVVLAPVLLALALASAVPAGEIVLVAGGHQDRTGIAAVDARLKEPFGAAFDKAGNLFIVEMASGNRLLKIDAKGILTHVAGKAAGEKAAPSDKSGDGGPVLEAQFNGPHNLAILPDGNVLIADTWNGRIRKVDWSGGTVTSLPGFEVPAEKARGSGPYCATLDFPGTKLYIADLRQVHVIDLKSGQIKVLAGNGQKGVPEDGAVAADAPLVDPRAVAPDRKGNVYILERGGHALRVVSPDGKIRTVVNKSGKKGADGDGSDGLSATMNGPKHLCIDSEDAVVIADAENNLIRKYIPTSGRIVRVAGTGKKGSAGVGGPPEQCELSRPHGVTVHSDGTLYITDTYNNRILKIAGK